MTVTPKDIDLSVNASDLERIQAIFAEHILKKKEQLSTTTGQPAWHIVAKIQGIDVEFVGEHEKGTFRKHVIAGHFETISVDNNPIPCLTLEAEANAYEQINRKEKAKEIRTYQELHSNKHKR